MPHFNIEKGVPMQKTSFKKSKYDELYKKVAAMEIGDSFTIPHKDSRNIMNTLQSRKKRKYVPEHFRFSYRREDAVTIRVWRVQ